MRAAGPRAMNEPMADESPLRALLSVFGGRARAEGRARLEAAGQAAPDGDYFAILGVPRDCSAADAAGAAEALLALLDAQAGERAEAPPPDPDLRQVLLDARDVLGDDSRRGAYLAALTAADAAADADPRAERSADVADSPAE